MRKSVEKALKNKWKYNDPNGYKLIELFKDDPERFAYQLYTEYCRGLELNTLRPLLHSQNSIIKKEVVWILSELGTYGGNALLTDAIELLDDEDSFVVGYALEIVFNCAYGEEYMRIFDALTHKYRNVRAEAMNLFRSCRDLYLRQTLDQLDPKKFALYYECISFLLKADTVEKADIINMLENDDPIKRKFAAIMAEKVYDKYPEIIQNAVFSKDEDIKYYAEVKMQVEKTYNRWSKKKLKRSKKFI